MLRKMKLNLEIFVLICGLINVAIAQYYCNPALCRKRKIHVACNNNGDFSRDCQTNPQIIPMTMNLRSILLDTHNQYRNFVASGMLPGYDPAIRMATMQWDDELAYLAAFNVKQCVMRHDDCRNTLRFPYSGQNLAVDSWFGYTWSVERVILMQMKRFFDEYKYASMDYINNYADSQSGQQIAHYTLLVQEKASRVGCSILRQERGNTTDQFLACNYDFTNIYNRPVYRSGQPASQCMTGVDSDYEFLCSVNEVYNVKSTNY